MNSRTLWLLALVCVVGVAPAFAQTQPAPEIQELKVKLLQLEQEMQKLKVQIDAAEQAQKPPSTPAAPAPSAPAEVKAEAEKPVEAQVVTAKPAEPPAGKKSGKGTFDVYGFVMMDAGYEFKQQDPSWFDVIRPVKMPSFNNEFAPDGNVYFSVRQTRFGVKSSTPTRFGDLKTIFEFELFGTGVDAGQTTFRLRHAYGELGQFGAGQTWSPFMDIDVFPNSLEYWGPNGMVFFRNVQFRWVPVQGDSRVTLALERPGASADQGIYANRIELQGIKPHFNMPDISGEARLGRKWGYVEVAGMLRKISWVDTNNDAFQLGGTAWGWGVNLSSNLKFSPKDTGRFQVIYSEGIQNYMNDAPVDIGIRNNFGNPVTPVKGVALPLVGIVAFLDHNWNDKFSSAVGYSMLDIQNSDAQAASAFNQGHYALGNVLFTPIKNVMLGSEFQFGRRTNFTDGFNANDYRLQISFKYNWSKGFEY